jgi:hypothetical protein
MSYDLNVLSEKCDHRVILERYIISTSDFRTLLYASNTSQPMRAPVNGLARVSMFFGGVLVSPDHPTYGYNLIRDTTTLNDPNQLFYKVVFNQTVRLTNPVIEMNYTTRAPYCRKCQGSNQTNDFTVANSGSITHVTGNLKLTQKVLKWILASTCAFYPNYTCPIKNYIGKKFGLAVSDSDISQAITTAIDTMQQVQQSQSTVQILDPTEVLKQILGISATLDPNNPTLVNVSLTVEPNAGNIGPPINFSLRSN